MSGTGTFGSCALSTNGCPTADRDACQLELAASRNRSATPSRAAGRFEANLEQRDIDPGDDASLLQVCDWV